jgi:hypothetical protein
MALAFLLASTPQTEGVRDKPPVAWQHSFNVAMLRARLLYGQRGIRYECDKETLSICSISVEVPDWNRKGMIHDVQRQYVIGIVRGKGTVARIVCRRKYPYSVCTNADDAEDIRYFREMDNGRVQPVPPGEAKRHGL